DAVTALGAAIKVKPDYAEAHYALGTVLQQQGNLDGAIAAFRLALKHAPNAPEIHNTLGTALSRKGDKEAARVEFQEAARLNKLKSNMQAGMFATNTGIAFLKEGKVAAAIERFQAAVELDPTNAQALYNLATALQRSGQRQAARAAYQKAKELDPRVKPLPQQ
ncbi:MAG TPA: tetratricopeptide repeat protein, partial [Pyrinomonadaceae bacterium]|nr:tetratricopeptide repeat protein [Pyrinomonadaceae bacterium]